MKTLMLILLLSFCAAVQAQEIEVGDTVSIENVRITKISGKSKYGYTEIKYVLPKYLLGYLNQTAEKEMWDEKTKKEQIAYAKTYEKGGELTLTIARNTIQSANSEWFTVIIKKDNAEVMRKPLKKHSPQVPGRDGLWMNSILVPISKPILLPFDLYVVESGSDGPLHFKILQ